mmetsp:Transcript_92826/g.113692  ORF Transcript_92826/g.113692 Transcript_92826/m.113692 type:complete len:222 (+) Transcript_92826:918-1583(+)
MHVLASWQHIRISDGVAARTWLNELTVQGIDEGWHFVVSHHLTEANLQVLEERFQVVIGAVEAALRQGLLVRGSSREEVEHALQGVHLLHSSLRVGGLLHQGAHCGARGQGDVLHQGHVLQVALVVALVDCLNVLAAGLCDDAREALDAHVWSIQLRNVHQGGNAFLCAGRNAHLMQTHWKRPRFNLHQQSVDLSHHVIALLQGHLGHVVLLTRQVIDVLV